MLKRSGDFIDAYQDDFAYNEECRHTPVVEARTIYILLPKNVPVSRCSRLQWLLQHLNTTVTVPAILKTVSWNNQSSNTTTRVIFRTTLALIFKSSLPFPSNPHYARRTNF